MTSSGMATCRAACYVCSHAAQPHKHGMYDTGGQHVPVEAYVCPL